MNYPNSLTEKNTMEMKLRMIDKLGNKNKAIEIAAKKGNATNYTAVNYPKSKKSLTETLSENKIFNLQLKNILN